MTENEIQKKIDDYIFSQKLNPKDIWASKFLITCALICVIGSFLLDYDLIEPLCFFGFVSAISFFNMVSLHQKALIALKKELYKNYTHKN